MKPAVNPWMTLQLPSGGTPGNVVLADFNADGRLDVVTAMPDLKMVSLFLQNAAGGFADRRDVAMDGTPGEMISGDFNEDGRLDLVVAGGDSGGVRVLMSDFEMPFASTVNIPMNSDIRFVSTEDLNQDGHLDLMAVGGANIQAWIQDANGGFARLFSYSLAEKAPNTAVFGDVSGDGITDVVLGYANANRLDVLTRTGNTFQRTSLNTFPSLASIEMGDLNGDHVLDVVTTHRSDSLVGIFWGKGNNQFKVREGWMSTGSGRGTIALGDLNRDGRPDIVTATTEQGVDSLRVILKR